MLDILKASTMVFDFLAAIRDPKMYIELDDTILHEVRLSTQPELNEARQLLARFDSRKHYSFVAEKVISS